MMLYPSNAQLLKKIDSRYLLVNVIAKRARDIAEKAEEEQIPLEKKPVSMAINEIADGRLTVNGDKISVTGANDWAIEAEAVKAAQQEKPTSRTTLREVGLTENVLFGGDLSGDTVPEDAIEDEVISAELSEDEPEEEATAPENGDGAETEE